MICGRNCALMYGEILDPNLPYLGCKTFRGLAFRTGPRIAEHHATPPPCNRAGLSRSGRWGPELHPSLIGIRLPVSSELTRTSCPGFGFARSSGILAYRHAGEESLPRSGLQWNGSQRHGFSNFVSSPFALQSRLPHPRRSCFAYAGWDSLIARSDHPRLR